MTIETAREADRSALVQRFLATPKPGLRVGLADSDLGLALPLVLRFIARTEMQDGIIRHDFGQEHEDGPAEFVIFELTAEADYALITDHDQREHRRDLRIEEGTSRFGQDPFGTNLILPRQEVGDQLYARFARAENKDFTVDWHGAFRTLAPYDQVEAPVPADLFADSARSARLGGETAFLDASTNTIKDALMVAGILDRLNTTVLRVPAEWRRQVGMSRRVSEMPGFYQFTRPEEAFLKGIFTANGEIVAEAIYDDIRPMAGGVLIAAPDG